MWLISYEPYDIKIFFDYDSVKGILDSIQLYFDFLDDLMDLGFISSDSLNNLNDFYMGKL